MLTTVKKTKYIFYINNYSVLAPKSYEKSTNLPKKFCEFPTCC